MTDYRDIAEQLGDAVLQAQSAWALKGEDTLTAEVEPILRALVEPVERERDEAQRGLGEYAEMCDEVAEALTKMLPDQEVLRHGLIEGLRLVVLEREEQIKALTNACHEVENCLGPEPVKCGCAGCETEMQMALEAVRRVLPPAENVDCHIY